MAHLGTLTEIIFLLFTLSNCSPISKLVEVAVNISSTYYKPHFVTKVVWKQNKSDCVNGFLKDYPGSVILSPWYGDNDKMRDMNKTVGFRQTIYFANTLHEYSEFMKHTSINEIIRFPNLFLLVLEKTIKNASELSAFNEVAWKNDQTNLVIISANDANEITLSTYFPYSEGLCGNYTPVFLKITDNMFPKKFANFYHCPIRISLIQIMSYVTVEINDGNITSIGGHNGEILTTLLNKLNASLEIISVYENSKFGIYVNGKATGCMDDLVSEKADMLIPSAMLTLDRYSVTTPSHIYHTRDIRWIGPKQREVYDWLKVIVPDRTNFTPLHGLTYISFVIAAMLIRKCKPQLTNGNNSILYQSFIILLGQSAKFVTKSSLLNAIFILWIWFCFIWRIDYQADLVEALQSVWLEPPLESVEEAVGKMYGHGGPELFRDFYKDTPLEQNYKVVTGIATKSSLRRILKGDKFLLAADITLLSKIKHYVQIMDKRISSSGSCFYMRPGWPAANDVDDIIVTLTETGYFDNILGHSDNQWLLNIDFVEEEETNKKALNMTTFSMCFYALALMWVICTIILAIEKIYYAFTFNKTLRVY